MLTRRGFLKAAGAAAAAAATGALGPSSPPAVAARADKKPNILLIIADDLGYADLGCQGCTDIGTPNIDSLARRGVRFTHGYVASPICSPSRAGLITGRYPQRFGHEFNHQPYHLTPGYFGLPETETTLADRLRAAGYATGMVGKWHLGYATKYLPTRRGFDEYYGFLGGGRSYLPDGPDIKPIFRGDKEVQEKEYLTEAFGREAAAFIVRHRARPFFLCLSFNAPHAPLEAPRSYLNRFPRIENPNRRTYAGMLAAMDDAVGVVLGRLRAAGLEDNTLTVFLSDNGGPTAETTSRNDPLRGYKGGLLEGGIRVPFLMQWPGRLPAGIVYDKPVIALDIAPTALGAAGVAPPADARFDGVDLLPYLTGKNTGRPHATLYWRYAAQRAIRHGDLKLIWQGQGKPGLYDVAADPGESKDLADARPDAVKDLQARFAKWEAQLAKPLWDGDPGNSPPVP